GNYGDFATFLGGGIYNDGTLTMQNNSIIDGTSAVVSINARHGGGLYADGGIVTISDSQIINNVADKDGGGIRIRSAATLNATGLVLDNNVANDDGGGLANEGVFTFTNGTIRNNQAADRGGGVDSATSASNAINFSCIVGNSAANTQAVYSAASNFNARDNWWGAATGAASGDVNNNVTVTPFVATNCADATAMGSSAMVAAATSSTIMTRTIEMASLPYETIFDESGGWSRTGSWVRESVGGRDSGGWVVDATIRNTISILEMPMPVDLGNSPNARVRYWQRGDLSSNDTLVLEILTERATTWAILDQQSNFSSDWTLREIDLSAYRGQIIRLRWRLMTVGDVPVGQNSIDYAIDDLQVSSRRN
ncbi:MAG: hypothetical protein Q9P44_04280, partial [Anaerolineae bacterium]|nr:hypothetical protein [Anaerolineae bacterium]